LLSSAVVILARIYRTATDKGLSVVGRLEQAARQRIAESVTEFPCV